MAVASEGLHMGKVITDDEWKQITSPTHIPSLRWKQKLIKSDYKIGSYGGGA